MPDNVKRGLKRAVPRNEILKRSDSDGAENI